MLDLKFVRSHCELVKEALQKRGSGVSLEGFLEADNNWRKVLASAESLKGKRNIVSMEIGRLKKLRAGCARTRFGNEKSFRRDQGTG